MSKSNGLYMSELEKSHEMVGELLEALKALMDDRDAKYFSVYAYNKAQTAVAKAEAK